MPGGRGWPVFSPGQSSPEEERRIRAQLASDPERADLVNALDAALARPDETPLSPREVDAALASVMARRELGADRAAAPSPDVLPFAPRPSAQLRQLRSRWRSAGVRAAAAVLLVAGLSLVWRANRPTRPDDSGRTDRIGLADASNEGRTGRHREARRRLDGRARPGEPPRASMPTSAAGRETSTSRARRTSTWCTTTPVRSSCGRRARRSATSARRSRSTAIPSAAHASR